MLFFCAFGVQANTVLKNQSSVIEFDTDSAQIINWHTCYSRCEELDNPLHRQQIVSPEMPMGILLSGISVHEWAVASQSSDKLELLGHGPFLQPLRLSYHLSGPRTLKVEISQLPTSASAEAHLRSPSQFYRPSDPGFAEGHEKTIAVYRTESRWQAVDDDSPPQQPLEWVGVRNRFWGLLAQDSKQSWKMLPRDETQSNAPQSWSTTLENDKPLLLYAGPLSPTALGNVDTNLPGIMFSGLWFWLRWLCFGLLAILNGLHGLIGNWGMAVLGLSLVVKILMIPLNNLAVRWQAQVNEIQSDLLPTIAGIKRQYKGEIQAEKILAAHKAAGVTPFYTLKSAFGFLIQIPVFIAAFSVLNESGGLNGSAFLWISDLARPDRLLTLSFDIPFFGQYFNLLPVIMTLVTLLASWQHYDPSLSDDLRRTQQRNLYIMAILFFLLFYTFPAGMVLYWTINNLLQLVKDSYYRLQYRSKMPA